MLNDSTLTSFVNIIEKLFPLIPGIAIILAIIIHYRTNSLFIILDKIWFYFAGQAEIKNIHARKLRQEMIEISSFRFFYRIPVSKIEEIKKIHDFKEQFDISFDLMLASKRYIDYLKFKLKKPITKAHKRKIKFCGLIAILMMASASPLGLTKSIYLRVNESKNYYLLNNQGISDLSYKNLYGLIGTQFSSFDTICTSQYLDSDHKTLCNSVHNEKEFSDFFTTNLKAQHSLAVTLFVLGFFWFTVIFRIDNAINAADEILSKTGDSISTK
jgi:hypothetical protein